MFIYLFSKEAIDSATDTVFTVLRQKATSTSVTPAKYSIVIDSSSAIDTDGKSTIIIRTVKYWLDKLVADGSSVGVITYEWVYIILKTCTKIIYSLLIK